MIYRSLRVLIAVCGFSPGSSELYGQTAVSDVAVVDLCPMPVFGTSSRDTMLTFMPDPTVEFYIRVVSATCSNPLAPDSVDGHYAGAGEARNSTPLKISYTSRRLRRWHSMEILREDSEVSTTREPYRARLGDQFIHSATLSPHSARSAIDSVQEGRAARSAIDSVSRGLGLVVLLARGAGSGGSAGAGLAR